MGSKNNIFTTPKQEVKAILDSAEVERKERDASRSKSAMNFLDENSSSSVSKFKPNKKGFSALISYIGTAFSYVIILFFLIIGCLVSYVTYFSTEFPKIFAFIIFSFISGVSYVFFRLSATAPKVISNLFSIIALCLFIPSLFGIVVRLFLSENDSVLNHKKEYDEEITLGKAYVKCKSVVKNNLKAPSTADFPFIPTYTQKIDDQYVVRSYVDAQNAFGAMIRSSFYCSFQKNNNNGSWELVDFKFDE